MSGLIEKQPLINAKYDGNGKKKKNKLKINKKIQNLVSNYQMKNCKQKYFEARREYVNLLNKRLKEQFVVENNKIIQFYNKETLDEYLKLTERNYSVNYKNDNTIQVFSVDYGDKIPFALDSLIRSNLDINEVDEVDKVDYKSRGTLVSSYFKLFVEN